MAKLIGRNIKQALALTGKSQQDLAEALGKDKGLVSRWCNDKVHPNPTSLKQIANFTGFSVNDILYGQFDGKKKHAIAPELTEYAHEEINSIMSFVRLLIKDCIASASKERAEYSYLNDPENPEDVLEQSYGPKLEVLREKIESLYKLMH